MTELNTQIELIVSEIIGATRKAKTLEDLGQANTNGINDITKLVKNLSLSGVSVSDLIEVNHAYIEDADQIGSYDVTGRVDRLWITSKEFDSIKDIAN